MELGWDKKEPLRKGIKYISEQGPSLGKANMYHNFFAGQALFSYSFINQDEGLKHWSKWQAELREFLINEQSAEGVSKGSWFFDHGYSRGGGRLYDTALATLTLEIYYRHLNLWKNAGEAIGSSK